MHTHTHTFWVSKKVAECMCRRNEFYDGVVCMCVCALIEENGKRDSNELWKSKMRWGGGEEPCSTTTTKKQKKSDWKAKRNRWHRMKLMNQDQKIPALFCYFIRIIDRCFERLSQTPNTISKTRRKMYLYSRNNNKSRVFFSGSVNENDKIARYNIDFMLPLAT